MNSWLGVPHPRCRNCVSISPPPFPARCRYVHGGRRLKCPSALPCIYSWGTEAAPTGGAYCAGTPCPPCWKADKKAPVRPAQKITRPFLTGGKSFSAYWGWLSQSCKLVRCVRSSVRASSVELAAVCVRFSMLSISLYSAVNASTGASLPPSPHRDTLI